MNPALACAACGRPLATADAVCVCEEARTAAAAAAQNAREARMAHARFHVCPSCGGHFSRAELLTRLFDPPRRRFGLPWLRLSCPHCAVELRSRHATSMRFRVAILLWLTGLPLYLLTDLPALEKRVMLAGWFALAAVMGLQEWRESRDPQTFEAVAPTPG